jgi:hypothetical protein
MRIWTLGLATLAMVASGARADDPNSGGSRTRAGDSGVIRFRETWDRWSDRAGGFADDLQVTGVASFPAPKASPESLLLLEDRLDRIERKLDKVLRELEGLRAR